MIEACTFTMKLKLRIGTEFMSDTATIECEKCKDRAVRD